MRFRIIIFFRAIIAKIRTSRMHKAMNMFYDNSDMFKNIPSNIEEYKVIEKMYLKILKSYCKYWLKINYKTTLKILFGFNDFNWERLHETEEEELLSIQEWLDSFRYEYSYIADRYSYTRMLRSHWKWLCFSRRFFKECNKSKNLEWGDENYYSYYDYLEEMKR